MICNDINILSIVKNLFYSYFEKEFLLYLIDACRENHMHLVKYLIELKQCDINQLTTSYETCLHGAILGAIENRFDSSFNNQQRFLIVKYLLSRSDCNPDLGMNYFLIVYNNHFP
jgi:hypothetical protein